MDCRPHSKPKETAPYRTSGAQDEGCNTTTVAVLTLVPDREAVEYAEAEANGSQYQRTTYRMFLSGPHRVQSRDREGTPLAGL
jgi:hypothetical protein